MFFLYANTDLNCAMQACVDAVRVITSMATETTRTNIEDHILETIELSLSLQYIDSTSIFTILLNTMKSLITDKQL